MQHSEMIEKIAPALVAAQAQFPILEVDSTVTVKPRARKGQDGREYAPASYSFEFVSFAQIIQKTRKPLTDNGLVLVQGVVQREGADYMVTKIIHESGQWVANEHRIYPLPSDNPSQGYGGGCRYAQRYGLRELLAVADVEKGNELVVVAEEEARVSMIDESLEAIANCQSMQDLEGARMKILRAYRGVTHVPQEVKKAMQDRRADLGNVGQRDAMAEASPEDAQS